MDRGVVIFVVLATVSLGTVWAVLSRPPRTTRMLPFSKEERSTWQTLSYPSVGDRLPTLSDPEVLPSSETDPAVPPEIVAPPRIDLLTSIHTQIPPRVTERFPDALASRILGSDAHSHPGAKPESLSAITPGASAPRDMDRERATRAPENHDTLGWRYHIRDGDTLPDLARRFYGDSEKWRRIFDANRAVIGDPSLLPIGTEIVIPYAAEPAGPPSLHSAP